MKINEIYTLYIDAHSQNKFYLKAKTHKTLF